MEENNRVGKNIKSLARAVKESPKSIAWKLEIAEATMYDVINGKQKASRPFLDKLAPYFGVSPEAILNDDFSGINWLLDPARFSDNIYTLLPVHVSEEALKISKFAQAYKSQCELYDAEKTMKSIPREECQRLIDDCALYFDILEEDDAPVEALVNVVSFLFYTLLCAKATEIIARYRYDDEVYPALLEKMMELNPEVKKRIKAIEEDDNLIDGKPFQDMIHDEEYGELFNGLFMYMKAIDECRDLGDYYICLQYVFGAVENNFTEEQNHEFGIDLMIKFSAMENEYAAKYMSIMDLSK